MFKTISNRIKYEFLKPVISKTGLIELLWPVRRFYHVARGDKLGKGIKYDAFTVSIVQSLPTGSFCVDIGAHKGSILKHIISAHPGVRHLAVEPITLFANKLTSDFPNICVANCALSDVEDDQSFFICQMAPELSGLRHRKGEGGYDHKMQETSVSVQKLDSLLLQGFTNRVAFIKIDVEGAELQVIRGAESTVRKDRPIIVFEFERSAGVHYNVDPSEAFNYICQHLGMDLYLLSDFASGERRPIIKQKFIELYESETEFYFVAAFSDSAS